MTPLRRELLLTSNQTGATTPQASRGIPRPQVPFLSDGKIVDEIRAQRDIPLALDAHPRAAQIAQSVSGQTVAGIVTVRADTAENVTVGEFARLPRRWTGESNWSGTYVRLEAGGSADISLKKADNAYIHAMINALPEESGTSMWIAVGADGSETEIGSLENGGIGHQGVPEAPGRLRPELVPTPLPEGTMAIHVTTDGPLELDGIQIQPPIAVAHSSTTGGDVVLHGNATTASQSMPAVTADAGVAFDTHGTETGWLARM